jgi:ketosteroid isomerase-like protein
MATESMKVVREGIAAWNQGDLEAAMTNISDDVVWKTGDVFPGIEPVYEGRDGVMRFFRDFIEPWETIATDIEEVLGESDEQIFIRVRFVARGREGIDVDAVFFQIYRFNPEGRIVWFAAFPGTAEADARAEAGVP